MGRRWRRRGALFTPPVRLYMSQASMVPTMQFPSALAACTASTFSSSQSHLKAEKYVLTGRPVFSLKASCMHMLHQRHDCDGSVSPETRTWLRAVLQTLTALPYCQARLQDTPAWLTNTSDTWPQLALLMHSAQMGIHGCLLHTCCAPG